jgi:hypothetical protein
VRRHMSSKEPGSRKNDYDQRLEARLRILLAKRQSDYLADVYLTNHIVLTSLPD